MKKSLLIFLFLGLTFEGNSQVLHTENFNLILDTTQIIKGSFTPSFRYRNVKEQFVEIENTADIAIRMGKNSFTIANKLEFAKFGDEDIMSGGFLYFEYRRLLEEKKLAIEPYVLILWQEIRGLEMKYAGGANLRYRMVHTSSFGFFAGIGALYEHERWNYKGTSDVSLIPLDDTDIQVKKIRLSSYFNIKKKIGNLFDVDFSAYYQPTLDSNFKNYRIASSSKVVYNFTKHIGLSFLYQNIYDPNPVVPIDTLFNDVTIGLLFSF